MTPAVRALFAALAGAAPRAAAQHPPAQSGGEAIVFQEIPSVYGVSRFEQKITEAPSFVTLITSAEIARFGYRTLAQALRGVTGLFVSYDRNHNYRSVVDVEVIDRIEVIRGPSSSLYGTDAFFGVIKVITKRGRDVGGVELSSEAASFQSFRGRATYGERIGSGTELLLSGSYYDAQGQRVLHYPESADPATGNGNTRNAADDRFASLFGELSVRDWTLQGGFVSREKGIATGSFGTVFPSDRTRSTDQHGYLLLDYQHHFGSQLYLSSRLSYDRFDYRADCLFDDPQPVLNRDRSMGEWWGCELKLGRRFLDSHNVHRRGRVPRCLPAGPVQRRPRSAECRAVQLEFDDPGDLGASGRIGYVWQRAQERHPAAGVTERLTHSPTNLLNLNLSLPIVRERVSAGLETLYVSRFDAGSGEQVRDRLEEDGHSFRLRLGYRF